MRILLMSDTHGNPSLAVSACDLVEAETVIHLGDGDTDAELLMQILDVPVIGVAGNCDRMRPAPRELLWECGGWSILLTHGDLYGVKGGTSRLEQRAAEVGAQAVFFGHTHIPLVSELPGLLLVNPGSLMSSAHGTCAMVDITPDGIHARLIDLP